MEETPLFPNLERIMISVIDAWRLICANVVSLPIESVSLFQSYGRILRENVVARRAGPPFHRVAMDGVALNVREHDLFYLRDSALDIEGIQQAGAPRLSLVSPRGVIEVMTGAILPEGCNCVVPYEHVEIHDGKVSFLNDANFKEMNNVHLMGSDFKEGDLLLESGTHITPQVLGILASVGLDQVKVAKDIKIAIFSTGDELVEPGEASILPYQIYKSNVYALQALLKQFNYSNTTLFHVNDNLEEIQEKLSSILSQFDLLILSGGVSKGKYDFIPMALEKLGVKKVFHGITQRPGKPLWFGIHEGRVPVFGLPGNPESAMVGLRRYIIEALHFMQGQNEKKEEFHFVTLDKDIEFNKNLTYFCPVAFSPDCSGRVSQIVGGGSGDFFKLSQSIGFVELNREKTVFKKGESYRLFGWSS